MFYKKTIGDVPLDNQTVLMRADYNVPIEDGAIRDDFRITQSIPTIKKLLGRGCKVIICSHLGRPKGKIDPALSLEPVAVRLSELLSQPVGFVTDCIGDKVVQAAKRLQFGQVLLLENVRFHPEEEENDSQFARRLALDSGARYFIQDCFGVAHRAHASIVAITQFLPSVAGLLLEREVTTITHAMEHPDKPLVALFGGAKISDKLTFISRLIQIADQIIIGGAIANTFLAYKHIAIGKSIYEAGQESVLQEIYAQALQKAQGRSSVDDFLCLPKDVVVAKSLEAGVPSRTIDVYQVEPDDYILDIGPLSSERTVGLLRPAKTVIWNGTFGMSEQPAYAKASATIAATLAAQKETTYSLIGGGDTADFVLHWDSKKGGSFGHVSTGGGASLQLMSGEPLPGVEALMDRS